MKGIDLKSWRKKHAYTQQGLGYELEVARQTVMSWEKSDHDLPRIVVLALRCIEQDRLVIGRRSNASEYILARKKAKKILPL